MELVGVCAFALALGIRQRRPKLSIVVHRQECGTRPIRWPLHAAHRVVIAAAEPNRAVTAPSACDCLGHSAPTTPGERRSSRETETSHPASNAAVWWSRF